MITIKQSGNFKHTESFLERIFHRGLIADLNKYGEMGIEALREATPKDTGKTASSWIYEIVRGKEQSKIIWKNMNVVNGVPVAIILQYGHATGNGGYVQGIDYINPALRPIFNSIANSAWEEITKS